MSTSEIVVTILVAVIGSGLFNKLLDIMSTERNKRKGRDSGVQEAARLLMKDRLRFLCVHYIQQGWIYEDELEDLVKMHHCYHNELNGNGFLDKQMERVNELEIRGIGVK